MKHKHEGKHVFESSQTHDYNQPEGKLGNCRGFPKGHTCLCGKTVWEDAIHTTHPPLSEMTKKIHKETWTELKEREH